MSRAQKILGSLTDRLPTRRPRWQYLVGGSIVGGIVIASGIAVAATSLEVLSDGSGGGGYVHVCDTTITGAHGAVVVTQGTTCIEHAKISGGVTVAAGASVIIEHSTISGGVSENKPNGTQICGSTIAGGVTVTGSTGFVLIGDPTNGCARNNVGSIVASNNHYGLVIVNNIVHGGLTATNNSGAGPLPGQTGPIVAGNHH